MFTRKINSITADFRITKEDGIKSLIQLMAEQNPQVIPKRSKLLSLYFIVSAENDSLILNGSSTSADFKMVIASGDDKLFPLSPLPFTAIELLSGATARTEGVCNFFVHIELN